MISREEERKKNLIDVNKAIKKRGGNLTIYDIKTTNYSDLKTWKEQALYSNLQFKIELLYQESLKNKGYNEKQIVMEMKKINTSKISINKDDTFNLVYYSDEEIKKSREGFIDYVVWDQMMLHNSPQNKIKQILEHYYPDILDSEIKSAIKKYEKKYNEDQDLKKSKTDCVYDNLNRLPGSGWSKQ